MDPLSRISAGPEVISAELGEEISLLNIKTGVYYTLNAMGATIWRQLRQPKGLSELRAALLEEFAVDEARCEIDLLRLVEDLRTQGLIELSTPQTCSRPTEA